MNPHFLVRIPASLIASQPSLHTKHLLKCFRVTCSGESLRPGLGYQEDPSCKFLFPRRATLTQAISTPGDKATRRPMRGGRSKRKLSKGYWVQSIPCETPVLQKWLPLQHLSVQRAHFQDTAQETKVSSVAAKHRRPACHL